MAWWDIWSWFGEQPGLGEFSAARIEATGLHPASIVDQQEYVRGVYSPEGHPEKIVLNENPVMNAILDYYEGTVETIENAFARKFAKKDESVSPLKVAVIILVVFGAGWLVAKGFRRG